MDKCDNGKVFNYSTSRCRKTCKMRGLDENIANGTCHKPCKTIKVRNPQFRCVMPSVLSTITDKELNKDIRVNLNYINDYISEGNTVKAGVEYAASPMFNYLMALYFSERYNTECVMPIYSIDHDTNRIISILGDCILNKNPNVLILPMILVSLDKSIETVHANMLIFYPRDRYVVRFEPHGGVSSTKGFEMAATQDIKHIMKTLNMRMKSEGERTFRYYKADNVCPRIKGLQLMGELAGSNSKESGFCVMWSWFFASCIIENPDVRITEVYKVAYNIMKNDPSTFRAAIRGYLLAADRELRKMKIFIGKLKSSPRIVGPSKYENDRGYATSHSEELFEFFVDYVMDKNE